MKFASQIIIAIIIIFVTASAVSKSQPLYDVMNVHMKNGTVLPYLTVDVDSITFGQYAPEGGVLVDDGFESYPVGSYPPYSDWYYLGLSHTGYIKGHQKVEDSYAHLSSKSMKMRGTYRAIMNKRLWISPEIINVQAYVLFEFEEGVLGEGGVGLWNLNEGHLGVTYAGVTANSSGFLCRAGDAQQLIDMNVNSETWYKISFQLNLETNTMKVWINDLLRVDGMAFAVEGEGYRDFMMFCDSRSIYFDDVKVWFEE